jgi:hypothetical protein
MQMNPTDFATDRRVLIQRMALLLGAAALPADAFAAPARRRRAAAARTLSAPLYAVLTAAADTIVPATDSPGALAAKVPQVLDGMLKNWASTTTRESITEALGRIDAAARTAKGKGFAALTTAERAEVLKPHDAAALTKVPAPAGAPPASILRRSVYVADQGYYLLKSLVLDLYYYSEAAASTELIYEHVPGKYEPSIKLTPTSRPYLSIGLF